MTDIVSDCLNNAGCVLMSSSASDWSTSSCTCTRHFGQARCREPKGHSTLDWHSHSKNASVDDSMTNVNEDKGWACLSALLWSQSARLHTRSLHTKYGSEIKLHQDEGRIGCIVFSSKVWLYLLWNSINTMPMNGCAKCDVNGERVEIANELRHY